MAAALALIGFTEALSSPEVAWSLVDAGFHVTAFSRKGRRSALRHSRYVTVFDITAPELDSSASLADLHSILSSNDASGPCVLFPLDDAALWLCCEKPLPQPWVLAGPSSAGARFALDKSMQINAALSAGLQVPQTTVAKTKEEILARLDELPLMLKPAKAVIPGAGHLRNGSNWICANRNELDHALSQWHEEYPLLVQPYLTGVGVGSFGFASARGVECWSAHRRLRMMNPHGSGSSACMSRSIPETVKAPIQRMIIENQWRGLFMVELLQDSAERYWFIEFNGRPWGSMALSRRQGLEYPAWNARLALTV